MKDHNTIVYCGEAGGAAGGFRANGIHCGIRRNREKPDLALIISDVPAAAAAVYTTNFVKGAPLLVTQEHLVNGTAQAIICNSGIANTCSAGGVAVAQAMCGLVETHTGVAAEDVIVASTGVIGEPLPLAPIETGMAELVAGLCAENHKSAARAIMTTDTIAKEAVAEFVLDGRTCRIYGMAKGSGMIHPNMATMLSFITSDVAIASDVLAVVLKDIADETFNMISIDGDTSTNDMCAMLSNGVAGNAKITGPGPALDKFRAALRQVMTTLAKLLAGDGEGATKLLECRVTGAKDHENARLLAKSVISSSLCKAAMFGADANWGRILCAMGYSGAEAEVADISVLFQSAAGSVCVCEGGAGVPFSEEAAKEILSQREITICIGAGKGKGQATAWGCDLTYDYVKINGDYRT